MTQHDQILHQQFSEYGRNAREWMRRCALLLPEINRRQIWRKKGCGSIYEYAGKLAGMSRSTVEEALRVLKKAEEFPALKEVVAEKGFQRLRPIISVVTPETELFWAEKAKSMSKHTLETYVQNYRLESLPGEETQSVKLTLDLPPVLVERLKRAKGDRSWEECFESLLGGRPVQKVQEATKSVGQAEPEPIRTPSRHIPVRIQRHVRARTGGLCAYPGCVKQSTSLHHTQRWALEKVHDPTRLHGLCTEHERLAHLGLIENEEAEPQAWRLRDKPDFLSHKRFVDQFVALYRPT